MTVTPRFIIICREAFLEAGTNNLNLIRIFTQIKANSFPYVLPSFALVVNFDIDMPGSHTLRTDIIGPDQKQIGNTELPVQTNAGNWQVIANFEQLRVATPGLYTFKVFLDGGPVGERTLEVQPAAAPKATTKTAIA